MKILFLPCLSFLTLYYLLHPVVAVSNRALYRQWKAQQRQLREAQSNQNPQHLQEYHTPQHFQTHQEPYTSPLHEIGHDGFQPMQQYHGQGLPEEHYQDHQEPAELPNFDTKSVVVPNWSTSRRARTPRYEVPQQQDSSSSKEVSDNDDLDSDYQEEGIQSRPTRAQSQRKRKGKAIATFVSPSNDEKSEEESEEDHSQMPDFGQRLQLHVDSDVHATPKRGRGRPLQEGSIRVTQDKRKVAFTQEWNRLGLGPHMTPQELAEQVCMMRIPDVPNQAKGQLAREVVASYSQDPQHLLAFNVYTRKLHKYAAKFRTREEYQGMDGVELYYLSMRKAIEYFRANPLRREGKSAANMRYRQKSADENMDAVGAFVMEHLKPYNLKVSKMSADQLDQAVRYIGMEGMSSKNFTSYWFQFLLRRKNVPIEKVNEARHKRYIWRQIKNNNKGSSANQIEEEEESENQHDDEEEED